VIGSASDDCLIGQLGGGIWPKMCSLDHIAAAPVQHFTEQLRGFLFFALQEGISQSFVKHGGWLVLV